MPGKTFKKIAVLMGGWCAERDVSLVSGKACAAGLRDKGYEVLEIDLTRDLNALIGALAAFKPDAVFNALHGRYGEDGCVQGVLEILGVPYTHSGPLASALAMDKQKAKEILRPLGMPCAAGGLAAIADLKAGRSPVPAPYVIKPNNEGSSVGVIIVRPGDNAAPAALDSWSYGPHALVETFIPGRELSVAVLSGRGEAPRALTVTEITTDLAFYDYEAKYAKGGSRHVLPAPIDAAAFEEAKRLAVLAHVSLGCTGASRSDFRYDDTKPGAAGLCYLETNTQPGMTPVSLLPEQAAHTGMSFGDLVAWLAENAALHA